MPILKSLRKYTLLGMLAFCSLTTYLAGFEHFSGTEVFTTDSNPTDEIVPRQAAELNFFHFPQVSNKYISPETSPGEGDNTLLAFCANQAANYTVKISAAYDPFQMEEFFFDTMVGGKYGAKYGAYRMQDGTWLVAAQPANRSIGEKRNIFLGFGDNPSNFSWQPLGLANNTDGIAVAGNGSHICVVYLEKFQVDDGPEDSWPVRWVKYFRSSDFGETWENGTLWDCSAWDDTKFSGISMDVNSTGCFECMWGFANSSAGSIDSGTIWETRINGSWAWFTPKNLTALVGIPAVVPQVMFNQTSGKLYICVNTASMQCIFYELGAGPDAPWTSVWPLCTISTNPLYLQIYCAIDTVNGHFYFANNSLGAPEGVRNSTNWKGAFGDYDYVKTLEKEDIFFLFAKNGPRMFVSHATSPIGGIQTPGILDAESPLCFFQYNGTVDPVEEVGIPFNGNDSIGNTHGARAFSFYIKIQADSVSKESTLYIGVDDTFPSLDVSPNTNYISPITSLGKNDSLQLGLTSNKSGTVTLRVESLEAPVQSKANITNEVYNYFDTSICGDGLTYYLFYGQSMGIGLAKLMMAKSTDGGLSWGDLTELDTTNQSPMEIHSVLDGNLLYCWYGISTIYYLLASFNGGESFVKLSLQDKFDQVAEDKSVWYWDADFGASSYNLSRSLDLGLTQEPYLSIPAMEAGYYSKLESVAFDPQSKNYSFIFTNDSLDVMAILADYDGANKIIREDIAASGTPEGGDYSGSFQVDAWHNSSGEFNWIITSGSYYPLNYDIESSSLAFCQMNSSGDITSWNNFTAISGDFLPCISGLWDLIFPTNTTPVFARIIVDLSPVHFLQIEVTTATSFVYSTTLEIFASDPSSITFGGFSSIGQVLPEGEYKWALNYMDQVGHRTQEYGTVIIDHSLPALGNYANLTTPWLAVPRLACAVTIPAIDQYLSNATLRYRTGEAQPWTEIAMDRILISPTASNFTGTIPALGSEVVYWQVEISDMASNSLVVDSNGQPYTYREPLIRIEEQFEPAAQIDLTLTPAFNVSFIVPEFSQYISYLYIEYAFDDGAGMHTAQLIAASPSVYYFTFNEFPKDATELNYTVYAVDLYGQVTPFGKVRVVSLLPALPTWDLSPGEQLFAVITALIVGIFTGLVYASLTRRKLKPVPRRETTELETPSTRLEGKVKSQGYKVAFIITALFIAGSLVGAYYFYYVIFWAEAAMLCFLGTFLATTVLWILFMDNSTSKAFREGRPRIRVALPLIVGFSVFIALVAMFLVGNNVAWWRVRINENPYVVFGIILPQLMTTLVATFFSSIIFLTRSIAKDVQRISKELADAELHNENPGRIFNRHETACQDILKSIGQKGVIFVAIIGITIVFASDLSAYALQGMLIILPFVGGALLTLFILNLRMKIKEKQAETILYDILTVCPKCGKQTTLGGSFCEHCGEALIKGTRVVPAVICPACKQLTPKGSSHCRFCNALLPQNPTPNI